MSFLAAYTLKSNILRSIVEHVFMPPKLPQTHPGKQKERKTNVALCSCLIEAAQDFLPNVPSSETAMWMHMIKMIKLARRTANTPFKKVELQRALSDMAIGDVFCMHIRAQNAALIVRRLALADFVQFEVFEVSPLNSAVVTTEGKLLCSYPGPAINVPTDTFMDECFLQELSSFLVQMDVDHLDSASTTPSIASDHPRYISELLVGILRAFGQPAGVDRITKRIGDEVLSNNSEDTLWRRSPLWLVLRVSLQSSLRTSNIYKPFVLFFHARLLRSCVRRDFPSELLFAMRAKMVRRLSKLGPTVSDLVCRFVNDTAKQAEALLSKRWTALQAIQSINSSLPLKTLDVVADSHITLNRSYEYLTMILNSASRGFSRIRFTPSHRFRLYDIHDFTQFTNGKLVKAIAKDPYFAITDFELSVERNLESWVAASANNNHVLDVIASCMEQYFSAAKYLYGMKVEDNKSAVQKKERYMAGVEKHRMARAKNYRMAHTEKHRVDEENFRKDNAESSHQANAEDNSIMILTIMDLWVALDRFAIQECPLLRQYSPEIPPDFLHGLLLHRSSNLKRASHIEEYLYRRHQEALEATSIFSNSVDDSCFALKYFHTSENLQRLHDKIHTHNPAPRRAELASLDERSKTLFSEAEDMEHRSFGGIHMASCQRCRLEDQAASLKISSFEWSLLSSQVYTQLAVFELSPPRALSVWRDMTYMVLHDIALHSVTDPKEQPAIVLDALFGLYGRTVQRRQYGRLTIGLTVTSVSDSAEEEPSVFAHSGLSFRLFDRDSEFFAMNSFSGASVAKLCSPLIPTSSPYSHLNRLVSDTKHTPNDIIATQADCPDEINFQEFISFSGLRSCPRLQWLNIARELASFSLTFSREEVHTLITQAAWQLGPLSNGFREWHMDLSVSSFGNTLLRELESLLEKIKANWQEEVTVRTIALICSRLLASTADVDICQRACALLQRARHLTFQWIGELEKKSDSPQDEKSRAGLQRRLCMLAATCFSTFDVCSEHLTAAFASDEDFSIAMQCAVIVYDNTPPPVKNDNSFYLTRMLRRHHRLLHNLEPIFSEPLPPDDHGRAGLLHAGAYDRALVLLWPSYRPHNSSCWHALPRPNSQWISCVSEGGQKVHYDLLTGELLVGRNRLGRLPQKILKHPTYESIFGSRIFDVTPANIPGMDYMTRSTVSGYQIVFSWNKGDLILQARKPEDSQILQLIPRSKLLRNFPFCFVDEYIHWLDLSTGELEFRPAGSPWTSRPSNWRLIPGHRIRRCAMLQKNSEENSPKQLINIRSRTFKKVSGLFSQIEYPENIIATRTGQTLEVSLPRLRLTFFVNAEWELECRSMPGYVVDKTQSCGTLFGLRNKLVLCPSRSSSEESLLPRCVIIPQGDIYFETKGDFTDVHIIPDSDLQHVPWHAYAIDTDLGCLTSNTSLTSKLYQCYLHALTSHCLPDPLLGHTGTEEALYILRSAACRSFQRLDVYEAKLLKSISNLSPNHILRRQSMTMEWSSSLPALSQHHDFFRTADSLLHHAYALEALYDSPTDFGSSDRKSSDRSQTLWNRSAFRNKSYYPSDVHISERSSSVADIEYRSRDVSDHGSAETLAYQTSWSILNSQPSPDHTLPELWDLMKSWGSLGPARSGISLRYSRYWLKFNAARDWFVIYDLCRKSRNRDRRILKIELSFSLSAAAYCQSAYSNIVPFLIIFALDERYRNLSPPPNRFYTLFDGLAPEFTRLNHLVSTSVHSSSPRGPEAQSVELEREEEYNAVISRESSIVAESILHQWPDYRTVVFSEQWFDKSLCHRRIKNYRQSISRNIQLREHVIQLQNILRHYEDVPIPTTVPYVFSPQFTARNSSPPLYLLRDVLVSRTDVPTPTLPMDGESLHGRAVPSTTEAEGVPPVAGPDNLEILIGEFQNSQEPLLQLYGDELEKSHHELLGQGTPELVRGAVPSRELLLLYHKDCSRSKDKIYSQISATLSPSGSLEEISRIASLWPRITPRSILRLLAQDRISALPDQWKSLIVRYAVSFVKYQQSVRLLELFSRQKYDEILLEIEAIRDNVLAESTPDWLLIQIDANIMARRAQVAVAQEMISPRSKRSISLQLNMGEGKSSVIVPLVASTLANGSNLVRVVTLKPLSNQMFEILASRLSGLANRPIFYVPFSRGLHLARPFRYGRGSTPLVGVIKSLYERCVAEGGILVVHPEHILSLKLMRIDTLLNSLGNSDERSIADELGTLQDWLAKVSRDVLDESDEILHVRYQLIYSAGGQLPVDDHPNRWVTIQQVFNRLQTHAVQLCGRYPKMLTIDSTLRGFPIIRILDNSIFQQLRSLIIDDALEGLLPNLSLDVLSSQTQAAARRFMSQIEVSDVDHALIQSDCSGTTLFNGVLLLRGLLMDSEGVLGYVLKERRWKVDYGLDPRRTSLAVPYRAKDVPTLRAEFGHPDVAIALTCLSYYYGGLTKDQVVMCFDLLAKLDNPEMEYDHWVELVRQDMPAELRPLKGVNMEDKTQVEEFLVPIFSRNKRTVDFYLSQVVFPRAAREFPSKLPTSAWDLVEEKTNVSTGFSGTNDNRYLLPTSITQEDPDFVLRTNALVLRNLLRPENDNYECTGGENGEQESAAVFLERLANQDPEIRVLLDVGAQMLELQNEELAQQWLSLRPDISAAIFFDDSDRLMTITPDGTIEPFVSSPFKRQLEKCVVYLDDAHTRGTDLKLRRGMRAAVTLGRKVTKDRLVQGCMRMRLLGKGHSVKFFAPGEVDCRIRGLIPNGMAPGVGIQVLDVVRWAMHETCEDIGHYLPHWVQQGLDHHKRSMAFEEYRSTGDLEALRSSWLQSESRTLEEMYWVKSSTKISPEIHRISSISDRIEQLGGMTLVDVRMAEEQEREVDQELDPVGRARPPKVEPGQHIIHEDIRGFVETGSLPVSSEHIFPLLAPVNMARILDSTTEWSPSPLATADFVTTTIASSGTTLTEYLRPVNWILSSGTGKDSVVVVISPYEANELLPIIRKSSKVKLHIYAPRVRSSMRSFSDLTFHSIPDSLADPWSAPSHVKTELNLFAGQLYFDSRGEYDKVCVLLALSMAHRGAEYNDLDGFVPPEYRTGERSPFETSRIPILKTLLGLRQKGMGYHRTHLGQILNGKALSEETLYSLVTR